MGGVGGTQCRQETLVLLAGKKSTDVQTSIDRKDKSTSEGKGTRYPHEIKLTIVFGEILGKYQNEIKRESQNNLS